jgi:hypothetical protein
MYYLIDMKKAANVSFNHVIVLILQHGQLGIKHSTPQQRKNRTEYINYF